MVIDMCDNKATLAGYTQQIELLGGAGNGLAMLLMVKPAMDYLGQEFRAYDSMACEWIKVKGWLFEDVIELTDEKGNELTCQ